MQVHLLFTAPSLEILKQSSPVSATVGKPYWIQCSVSTSEKVNSRIVKIDWSGPDGSITNDSRITVHPTLSDDGIVHNSTLEFLYLSQNDTGAFTCNVTILDTNVSETFLLDNITSEPRLFYYLRYIRQNVGGGNFHGFRGSFSGSLSYHKYFMRNS